MEKVRLIRWRNGNIHVSQETVKDLEEVIESHPEISVTYNRQTVARKIINKMLKVCFLNNNLISLSKIIPFKSSNRGFAILMGNEFEKCLGYFFLQRENFVYFFDAWPANQIQIKRFLQFFNVKAVFFSSKTVAESIRASLKITSIWIPEAINIDNYRHLSYESKTVDVLQFGRKYDLYHEQVCAALEREGYCYLYEKVKGHVVFPTQEEFLEGLSKTKISICFPSSLTHPSISGGVSTMTVRYLQSMASKCLIVGVMPEEMGELFDYTPIIEADFEDPVKQLLSILNNYEEYIPLIEKNYAIVKSSHTWEHRSEQMMQIIFNG